MTRRWLAAVAVLLLAACTAPAPPEDRPIPDFPRLHDRPEMALLDHLLTVHEAGQWNDGTGTCAARFDGNNAVALAFQDEADLMARHIWLAAMDHSCTPAEGGFRDPYSNMATQVVEVSGLDCADADHCTGIGTLLRNGGEEMRYYAMNWRDGMWRFHEVPALP